MKKFVKDLLEVIIVVVLLVSLFWKLNDYTLKHEERIVYLQSIDEEYFCYVEDVVSNIPANNYSIITFCNSDGKLITVKGDVSIEYTTDDPYAVWEHYPHITKSDFVKLYIPSGTLKYFGSSGMGN